MVIVLFRFIKVLCLLIFFSACSDHKEDNYVWKVVDVDFADSNSEGEWNHDNCFLNIVNNESYVFFLNGYYSDGKMKKSGEGFQLLRSADRKVVATLGIEKRSVDEAIVSVTGFDTSLIQKTGNGDEVSHSTELPARLLGASFRMDVEKERKSNESDPYAARNNQWRVKASRKESDSEIKLRVKNHVMFMQYVFEHALEIGLSRVSEPNIASPFEVYSNGVSMRKFEEIDDWKDLFYDEDDARKGYDILHNVMSRDFTLLKTRNAFELNADIFRKMVRMLD
jgi:hypothetical protein